MDEAIRARPRAPLSEQFGAWTIEEYAALYLTDLSEYPHLSTRLPMMPSPDVQREWTGSDGATLMAQSIAFTRSAKDQYERISKRPLREATALDYGAGWGRLTRMFLQFIPPSRLYACDAWPKSVNAFRALGFPLACDLVDKTPKRLPYDDGQFDLVWLFAVLTHLTEPDADAVMSALHPIVKPAGLLVATIRPVDYWSWSGRPAKAEEHAVRGYAHDPHYPGWGDTSMSLAYMAERWPRWRIMESQRIPGDTFQVMVCFQPT